MKNRKIASLLVTQLVIQSLRRAMGNTINLNVLVLMAIYLSYNNFQIFKNYC